MQQVVIAGRYRLLELVGRGGMGRVWLARDEVLHREVAVKEVVPPGWLADAERDELRLRTLREARTAARLNHPNVVRIYDVVQVEDRPWIVMEYVPSLSLQTVLDTTGPVDPVRAADVGMALLAALRAAHHAGVLHRDVKPQNVLVADDGRVMLTDFGLATFDGGDGLTTRPGMVLGSPQFVAPERAAEGVSSVEADLWSLGATLHAAVEGRSPYARSTAMATLAALATAPPDPAPHAGPLRPVLEGLLRRDPRKRIGHDEAGRRLEMVTRPVPTVEPPTVILPVARSAANYAPPPPWPGAGEVPGSTPRGSTGAGHGSAARPGTGPTEAGGAGERPTTRSPSAGADADAERDWGPPGRRPPGPLGAGGQPDPARRPPTSYGPPGSGYGAGPGDTRAGGAGPECGATRRPGHPGSSAPGSAQRAGGAAPDRTRRPVAGAGALLARLPGGAHRWALAGVTLAVAVTVGVGTALALDRFGDGTTPDRADVLTSGEPWEHPNPPAGPNPGGPGPRPGGPGIAPPPFPCLRPEPVGAAVTGRPATVDDGFRPPTGWTWFDGAGYRVAVPVGWLRSQEGVVVCFRDPASRRTLSVEPVAADGTDPVDRLRADEREQLAAGALPGYDQIALAATNGAGARWECRWDTPFGGREHGLRLLPGRDLAGFVLSWSTADEDWAAARDQLAVVRESFRPRSTELVSPT
ncbi:protein kinase [Micromonospora sp. NPDC092111]|uniref:protein kinase domain-containing protein n=1 Tax=Micromonospora sp. NPDC092111 TaxID=3364289 RepID=UPI0037F3DA49